MRDYPQHEDLRPGNSDAVRAATPTASEPTTQLKTETEKF